jgi:predicted RNase H-like HicB family nuclease
MWKDRKWEELMPGDKVQSLPVKSYDKPVVIVWIKEHLFGGDDGHRHFRHPYGSCYGEEIRYQRWEEAQTRYDEYTYTVSWSTDDKAYVAKVAEFESLAAHGDSEESALLEIQDVVKNVLADLEEEGEFIPLPKKH